MAAHGRCPSIDMQARFQIPLPRRRTLKLKILNPESYLQYHHGSFQLNVLLQAVATLLLCITCSPT
jgi:hypothetical protein